MDWWQEKNAKLVYNVIFFSPSRWVCDWGWCGLRCHWGALWGGVTKYASGDTIWEGCASDGLDQRAKQQQDSPMEKRDEKD